MDVSEKCVETPNKSGSSEFEKDDSNEPKDSPIGSSDFSNSNDSSSPVNTDQSSEEKNLSGSGQNGEDFNNSDNQNGSHTKESVAKIGEIATTEQSVSLSTSNVSEVVVKTSKPLCADYQSDSDSEFDSESDSSSSTEDTTTESSSDGESEDSHDSNTFKSSTVKGGNKSKGDLSLADLPPIENLTISVPEDACVEIGTITSIVDTLVIVESYHGTAALDIDSVLFLDSGRKTLGKVFDILGPITEPVYAVRFNNKEQIDALNIKKDMKVYCAPKTEHTNFVFLSEVLKHKGSDASWKDNAEAPPEFQDFSDDEEERLFKNKQSRENAAENSNPKEQTKSRKRSFNKVKHPQQQNRHRNPNFQQQRPHFHRNPAAAPRPNFPGPVQGPPFPYRVHSYPNPLPPHLLYPSTLSGPPFPTFGHLPFAGHNFQQPFYQQRTHSFPQGFGAWGRVGFRPPPPPPPPSTPTLTPTPTPTPPAEQNSAFEVDH